MISSLRGIIYRQNPEEITLDVHGVGYKVYVPISVWDALNDGEEATLHILTYVREDRLDLFGFMDRANKTLFERFIAMNGIGPKSALELCSVPKSLLMQAIGSQDSKLLTTVKGIGKKTAEKLLVDLKALAEKQPDIFGSDAASAHSGHAYDQDAIDALKNLGYDSSTVMQALQNLPADIITTEERVASALRNL